MSSGDLLRLSALIVSAQAGHHNVTTAELPAFIRSVYDTLSTLGAPPEPLEPSTATPAAAARQTVFPGYIICLEDGRKFKMLKRHLRTFYGMTPQAYRAKWGLPYDYPMTAPDYVTRRSAIAKEIGLGHIKHGRGKARTAAKNKAH